MKDSPALLGTGRAKKNFMENLRDVVFTLERGKMSFMDYSTQQECEEKTKERTGYLHCFGNEPFFDNGEAQRWVDLIVAIVEEKGTGQVYHVIPEHMRFVPVEIDETNGKTDL